MESIRKKFHIEYFIIDVVILIISFYFWYLWRYNHSVLLVIKGFFRLEKLQVLHFKEYTSIFIIWSILNVFTFARYHLFTTNRGISVLREIYYLVKALALAGVPTAAAIFLLKYQIYSRFVYIAALITAFIFMSSWRIAKRLYIIHRLNKGLGYIRVLILGSSKVGQSVAMEMNRYPYLGLQIAGFLSEERNKGEKVNGINVLGNFSEYEKVLRENYIDEVYITQNVDVHLLENFIFTARNMKIGVKVVPELYEHVYGRLDVYRLGYINFIEYTPKIFHGTDLLIKRIFDILGSYLLTMLALPLMGIIALIIKAEDNGPVFYTSKRVGRKSRVFDFYKFRTMVVGADKMKQSLKNNNEVTGPVFKIKKDPRITNIGRLLRKWSLDELPQLFNVLKGDMSLVGPRPPIPREVRDYEVWQKRRLDIKPGITCLWQVRGRSNLSFFKWVKWDLWYIDNWSIILDIRILLWTIPAVVRKCGAY